MDDDGPLAADVARALRRGARAVVVTTRAQNPTGAAVSGARAAELRELLADHPDALAWLARHWGVTERLRQVCLRSQASTGRRLPHGHAVVGYGFFTTGETPHAAVDTIAAGWPGLRFVLVPRPAD